MSVPRVHFGALILALLTTSWRLPFTKSTAGCHGPEEQRQPESQQGERGSFGMNAQRTEPNHPVPRTRSDH